MDLPNVRTKLDYLFHLVESDGPKRTVLAEIDDIRRIVMNEEIKVQPFPVYCEKDCPQHGTPQAHTQTSQAIAEQAYANYRRHYGHQAHSLNQIKTNGGFGCVEIRMLLRGLRPDEFTRDTYNGAQRKKAFLHDHSEIKL